MKRKPWPAASTPESIRSPVRAGRGRSVSTGPPPVAAAHFVPPAASP